MAVRGEGVRCVCRWLVVVTSMVACWAGMVGQVSAQTCTTVADTYHACEQSGTIQVSLSCPDTHLIQVLSLSYRVAATPACPAAYSGDPPSDHCLVNNDPAGVFDKCDKARTCTQDVVRDTSGTCGGTGAHYIRVVHYCEPLLHLNLPIAGMTSMASQTPLSGLQVAFIGSKPLTDNSVTFSDTSVACIITIPDNMQVIFRVVVFRTDPSQSGCNQKIQFWDGVSYERTICSDLTTDMMLGGCDTSGMTFYIKYLNSDPNIKAHFVISVGVSHHATTGFNMMCGLPVAALPKVVIPTTTTPDPAPATQAPANGNHNPTVATAEDKQSLKLVIIVVSVAVSLIIVVIIIGVLIKKYSRKSTILEGSEPEDLTDTKPVFNYVRNIYLHGDRSSRLVMDRRRSSTPSSASMGLRV